MTAELLDTLSPWLIGLMITLAVISFLRVLASYRQREVHQHNARIEAQRLRQEAKTRGAY